MPLEATAPDNPVMKARVGIGPITLDVEDSADRLTLLVTKIVESFIGRKIIETTAVITVSPELKPKVA